MDSAYNALQWVRWNVFLAVIPVVAAYALAFGAARWTIRSHRVPWIAWLPLFLVWIAFLPNTCYLLTEWRHFLFNDPIPQILRRTDTNRESVVQIAKWGTFFILYSGVGAVCFVLSIRPVHRLLKSVGVPGWLVGVPFFSLASLGVYLGLIVRLNSWDIIKHPGNVWNESVQSARDPTIFKLTAAFAVLLWLMYWIGDVWFDGLMGRIAKGRRGS
jgi:uncharacterized membrane protein